MASALPTPVRERLRAAGSRTPEWKHYLGLLEGVLEEDASGRWDGSVITRSEALRAGAPLLEGATIEVAEKDARRFAASILGAKAARRLDLLALLSAAASQDAGQIATTARAARVEPEGIEALAGLAASPMLRAAARALAAKRPSSWPHGHCPVCGAWPALGELRGLERERHLRCGRCAADWRFPWLRCAHCGDVDEKRLSFLVLEADPGGRRVETCGACRGYLKSVATLSALSPPDLALADLETVDLDLAAQERGWRPPASPARTLSIRVEFESTGGPRGAQA